MFLFPTLGVIVSKKKCAWVVGDYGGTGYGMILYSADGGDTWER